VTARTAGSGRRRAADAAPERREGEGIMLELLALGTLLLFGLLVVGLVGGLLKLVFWLLFLPFRLALKLLALPFLALGLLLKLVFGVLLLPLFLVLGVVAVVGFGLVALLGLLLPVLPLIIAGLVVWGLVKFFSRPAAVTRA
jgi:nitrate reductase NapE component